LFIPVFGDDLIELFQSRGALVALDQAADFLQVAGQMATTELQLLASAAGAGNVEEIRHGWGPSIDRRARISVHRIRDNSF
jgi:hypothetical protein